MSANIIIVEHKANFRKQGARGLHGFGHNVLTFRDVTTLTEADEQGDLNTLL